MNKVIGDVDGPMAELPDNTSPAVAGFGPGGVPNTLIQVLHEFGVPGPSVVSDDYGAMESALAVLLSAFPGRP